MPKLSFAESTASAGRPGTDLALCESLMRGGSKSFFAASRILPTRVRAPSIALYAFCRLADDAVDLAPEPAGAVDVLKNRLGCLYAGAPADIAADRAFSTVVHRYGIPPALPLALLEGFEWDTAGRRYETLSGLYDYAARVAGTVGAMMALIMGARSQTALARACDLGVAMQLTNIARDVGEDARAGRLYLPLSWLREAGIDPDRWLQDPVFSPALAGVVTRLLEAADLLYRRAEQGIGSLQRDCRPAIMGARLVYAEIGREIERAGLDTVNRRAVVGGRRKLALMGRALAAAAMPRRTRDLPALAEVQFMIDAITAHDRQASAEHQAPAPQQSLDERVGWVLSLFQRLGERDRANAVYGRLPGP
jgi:phytoene synthase